MAKTVVTPQSERMADWVHGMANWSVIAHHTWAWRDVGCMPAAKMFERFMEKRCPEVSYFYAIEQNPSDRFDLHPGHHVHALWANCDEVVRSGVWRQWFEKYGRARIEPCRSREDVSGYCAKYLTKDGAWWNFRLDRQSWLKLRK